MPEEKIDPKLVTELRQLVGGFNRRLIDEKDFDQKTQQIHKLVAQIVTNTQNALKRINAKQEEMLRVIDQKHGTSLSEIKGQVDDVFVRDRIESLKGENDLTRQSVEEALQALREADIALNQKIDSKLKTIKNGRDGTDGRRMKPEEVRNKLESLEGDDRLDADAIKGLRKAIQKFGARPTLPAVGVGHKSTYIDISDQLDGEKKTFNISAVWKIISVHFTSAPWIARPTVDYTHDTQSITFTDEIDAATTLKGGQTVLLNVIEA